MICNDQGIVQTLGPRAAHPNDMIYMFPYLSKSDMKEINPTEEDLVTWRSQSTFTMNNLQPCVTDEWTGHFLISGATGSGKTWVAKEILRHSSKKIVLVTDIRGRDQSLKVLERQGRIERATNPIRVSNAFVLFDDVRSAEMNEWRDKLYEQGRHANVTVITINHRLREGLKLAKVIQDSEWIVLFPCANKTIVNNYLGEVLRIPTRFRNALIQLACRDGRYLYIHNWAPNFFMTAKSVIPF